MEIFYTPNTYGCTYHVWPYSSKWYIFHHWPWKYISVSNTHMLHTSCMSVHGIYTLTFYDVSTLRHMSTWYTHMLHISPDVETTPVSTWNRRPVPASRGYVAQWQCNWVTDSRKSNLLRILHKKTEMPANQFTVWRWARKASFTSSSKSNQHDSCVNRDVQYFMQKVLPADDIATGLCNINKQGYCLTLGNVAFIVFRDAALRVGCFDSC